MRQRTGTHQAFSWMAPRQLFVLALSVALGAVTPAWAADDDDDDPASGEGIYEQTGVYLGAMAGLQIPAEKGDLENEANFVLGAGTDTDVDNSFGLSGRLGYRLHPRFAVESQFEWLNTIELDHKLMGGGEAKTEIKLFTLTGNAKAYLLTGRFQPYVVAGAGWSRSSVDSPVKNSETRDDGFATRIGAGIDIYGSPDVALTTEVGYVLNTGALEDLDYLSIGLGLTLRFYPAN